ncbi:MAG: chitobiase/beta-hexosaminidase C-terminal domain-containing protein [Mucilaginibacter sp.]
MYTGRLANKLFVQDLEKPVSKITDELIVSNPYFVSSPPTFKKPFDLEIKCADANARIYYSLDGSEPTTASTLYVKPITISANTTVKAIAVKDGKQSFVDEGTFTKIRDDIKLTLLNKYLVNYPAQGDESLIDGLRGTVNWRLGHWQGYQGTDLAVVIDMGQIKPVNKVSIGTLQDSRSWIAFPKQVEYWVSDDGKNYKLAATVNTKVDIKDTTIQTQNFTAELNLKTRYIKLIAKQYGPLPDWHESKGEQSYIFADEITIE